MRLKHNLRAEVGLNRFVIMRMWLIVLKIGLVLIVCYRLVR